MSDKRLVWQLLQALLEQMVIRTADGQPCWCADRWFGTGHDEACQRARQLCRDHHGLLYSNAPAGGG